MDYKVGMVVRVRDDVSDGDNGISNAASYEGRVMTVKELVYQFGKPVGVKFVEDGRWWWSFDQIEHYDDDFEVNKESLNEMLEGL